MKPMTATAEVQHKLKCGQNVFKKPLIEKMMEEVLELAKDKAIDIDATIPQVTELAEYPRPGLTTAQKAEAERSAKKLIAQYGINNLPKMLAMLCIENVRLVNECQDHRKARGFKPMEVHKV